MKNKFRLLLRALSCALALFPLSAHAQLVGTDTVPGTACSAKGSVQMTANAIGPGAYILTCDGDAPTGKWVATINAELPTANAQVANKEYVDSAVAAAGSLGACTDDDTTLCALLTPRVSNDPQFIAANIRSGINILGTTGTYDGCSLPPDEFGLTDIQYALEDDRVVSNIVTMPAIGPGFVAISISGSGSPEYRVNGGTWRATPGTIQTGETLQLRLTSPATELAINTATVTIGGVSDPWAVRSLGCSTVTTLGAFCPGSAIKYAGTSGGNRLYTTVTDQSTAAQWGTSYGFNDIATDSDTDGLANSNQVANSTTFPAFKLCKDLGATLGGTWYLPAKDELAVLRVNRVAIGGFSSTDYWSSTESGTSSAWNQVFTGGGQGASSKVNALMVRCVRR